MNKIRIPLHFLDLNIETHSQRLKDWLTRLYTASNQHQFFAEQSCTYKIQLEELNSDYALAITLPPDATFSELMVAGAKCYFKDGKFYVFGQAPAELVLECDVAHKMLRASVGGALLHDGEFIYDFMRDVLRKLILPFSGMVMLHGAVLSNAKQSVFLSGDTGAGKTTVALELMRNGFLLLSDDSPLFTYQAGRSLALSSLEGISVTEPTLALFPEMHKFIAAKRVRCGKYALDKSLLHSQLTNGPLEINHVILLDRGNYANANITAINRQVVLRRLVAEAMIVFREPTLKVAPELAGISERMFEIIAAVVSQADASILRYGNDHLPLLAGLINNLGYVSAINL